MNSLHQTVDVLIYDDKTRRILLHQPSRYHSRPINTDRRNNRCRRSLFDLEVDLDLELEPKDYEFDNWS